MHIIAKCPRCGYRWWLDAAAADRRVRCRKCHTLLKVPDVTEVPDAVRAINQAQSDIYVDDTGKLFG
jgi:tRNA(Ile2) C34 agmatinyltransferase TiaS